jgi:glycosyltransferase involved in cell wall biosynthesis
MTDFDAAQAPLPGLSVIIPTFNKEAGLRRAIESLQSESGVDLEILVADDDSSDGTANLLASMAAQDPRIRPLHYNHRGPAAARNKGLREAGREFVSFLDPEAICAPGRLARQISKLQANPELDAVIGHTHYFEPEAGAPFPGRTVERNIGIRVASTMFPRTLFERFKGFDENLTFGDELDFYCRLLEGGCLFLIETEAAVFYPVDDSGAATGRLSAHGALLKGQYEPRARESARGRENILDMFFRNFDKETLFGGRRLDTAPAGYLRSDAA